MADLNRGGGPNPSEIEGYTWQVLGMSHVILWRFQDGQSITTIAEHYGIAVSAVEWWLRIAVMPEPFADADAKAKTRERTTDEASRAATTIRLEEHRQRRVSGTEPDSRGS